MSQTLATLHLNSSVYELMENAEKTGTQPLFKQVNNPLLVKGVVIERRIGESWNEVEEEICNHFEVTPDQINAFGIYPMDQIGKDDKINLTLAYGHMVKFTQPDPKTPVAVPVGDPEAEEKAIKDALTPKPYVEPFFMIVPETDEYMFSLSLDHVPASAITAYQEGKVPTEIPEGSPLPNIPMGVDMSQAYISPEDQAKYLALQTGITSFIQAWEEDHPGEPMPEAVDWGWGSFCGPEKLFKDEDEIREFIRKYAYMFSMVKVLKDEPSDD